MALKFRGAALEAQSITAPEWILAGPSETGKTIAALWRLDQLLKETPRAQAALVRKVAADIGPTVLITYKRVIERSGSGAAPFGGEKPDWFQYPNGARLYIGGMDRPGKVLSGERDWIYVNQAEELLLGDWETLSTRCTGRGAVTSTPMLLGDCNPGPPTHWILRRERLKKLFSKHEDNPVLFDDSGNITEQGLRTMEALDNLTGVRKERLRYGRWVAAEGVVYETWDRSIHWIDSFPIPPEWRRIRSIDLGYTNPFSCQRWAADPDGRIYLYRERYKSKCLVEDHAKAILASDAGEKFEANVCDWDAEDRATLEKHGIKTVQAFKAVTVGIEAVQARLKKAGDGKARLFIFLDALEERDEELERIHKPVCTAEEIEAYSWAVSAEGKPTKEEPIKVNDHGMDAMRYAVTYFDGLARNWIDSWVNAK